MDENKAKHQKEHDEVVSLIKRYMHPTTPINGIQFGDQLVGYVIAGVGYVGARERGVEVRLRKATRR